MLILDRLPQQLDLNIPYIAFRKPVTILGEKSKHTHANLAH